MPHSQGLPMSFPHSTNAAQAPVGAAAWGQADLSNALAEEPGFHSGTTNSIQQPPWVKFTWYCYSSATDGYDWWSADKPTAQSYVNSNVVALKLKYYCRNVKQTKGPSDSATCLQQ